MKLLIEDLVYRIVKFKIEIPPPRKRIEEIPELVYHFARPSLIMNSRSHPKQSDFFKAITGLEVFRQLEATIETMIYRRDEKIIREKDVCKGIPHLSNRLTPK